MTQNLSLPVVFLHDTVVLPGMVVPIELDDSSRAAIDAARLAGGPDRCSSKAPSTSPQAPHSSARTSSPSHHVARP